MPGSQWPANLLKKRLWHKCFPAKFVKFLRTPFLPNTFGRLLRLDGWTRLNMSGWLLSKVDWALSLVLSLTTFLLYRRVISRVLNNKLNRLLDRCLRVIYNHRRSTFEQLLDKNNAAREAVAQTCSVKKVFWENRDSGTGVFLWILQNFWEHLFLKNTSGCCFCRSNIQQISISPLHTEMYKVINGISILTINEIFKLHDEGRYNLRHQNTF